jgi:hypothetical protein
MGWTLYCCFDRACSTLQARVRYSLQHRGPAARSHKRPYSLERAVRIVDQETGEDLEAKVKLEQQKSGE